MKLVQLLAKELKEWPEGAKYARQDFDGEICFVGGGIWSDFYASCVASDIYLEDGIGTSQITEDQWQYEREKMNKPKWIRHRGSWMPVGAATIVEVRLRCGDIQKHEACEFLWRHKDCDSAVNIMAYRVIEETKDQEIEEVKVAGVKLEMMQGDSWATIGSVSSDFGASVFDGGQPAKREEVKKTNFGTITYNVEIDATEATKEIDSLVAKWGQIESPLKWRDAIIHCQAIIEDCEREIERNTQQLAHEGFLLIALITDVSACVPAVDMSDPENWQEGDIVVCVKEEGSCAVLAAGKEYALRISDGDLGLVDEEGDHMCACLTNGQLEFVRRP